MSSRQSSLGLDFRDKVGAAHVGLDVNTFKTTEADEITWERVWKEEECVKSGGAAAFL